MVVEPIQRGAQCLRARRAGGNRDAEELLLQRRVILRVVLHRNHAPQRVGRIVAAEAAVDRIRRARVAPAPAGEHAGQPADVVHAVGVDRFAVDQLRRAVGVELDQSDREQLHHLARIVLVRHAAVVAAVGKRGEVLPHRRVLRDRLEQFAIVAEGMGRERVQIGGQRMRGRLQRGVRGRGDEDLRQRVGHALPQRIRAGDRLFPESPVQRIDGDRHALGGGDGKRCQHEVQMRGTRNLELLLDPVVIAEPLQAVDFSRGCSEGRLRQEADRLLVAGRCGRRRGRTRRCEAPWGRLGSNNRRRGWRRGRRRGSASAAATTAAGQCQGGQQRSQ